MWSDTMNSGNEGFDHMTVVVTDLKEAKNFFELLGFEETQAVVVSGEAMSKYMGIPDWEADHVTLALRDARSHQEVQLLRFDSPQPMIDPEAGSLARTGFNHVCFRVRDLAGLLARLKEHGVTTKNEVMTFHDRRLVFLSGPAGLTVELAEWLVAPAP
jgi:catechol 2,3-dioxygenase-like lactoylglutathione lyase family enzyme